MTKLMDFMEIVDDTLVFTGDKLEALVPVRYKQGNLLIIGDDISALGIFEIIVNDTFHFKLNLPCVITMSPSTTYKETKDDINYLVCIFRKGDKFLTSRTVIKQSHVMMWLYNEFISMGNFPSYTEYRDLAFFFDTIENMTEVNLETPHSVFELIYAYFSKDPNDLFLKYRYTDMKGPYVYVGSKSVAFGPDNTTAKLTGAYFNDGVNSALINASDKHSDIEDLLRS